MTLDNPPVNALSTAVRTAAVEALKAADADPKVQAIVIMGAGRGFSGGADITEFGKPPVQPTLLDLLDVVEGLSKPVVAAIHGVAFGGGLELSLTCHFRVADKTAQLGLPEVKLGLLPGAGGTQRLPRVVGAEMALNMIVSGDPIRADAALEAGLIDELVEGELEGGRGGSSPSKSSRSSVRWCAPATARTRSRRRAPIPACSTVSRPRMRAASRASSRPASAWRR